MNPELNLKKAYVIAWRLVHKHKPAAVNGMEEEDYVQEMVLHCYNKWSSFDASRGNEGQFLYTVAQNKLYSLIKSASREAAHFVASAVTSPETEETVQVVEIVAETKAATPEEKTLVKEVVSKIVKFARRHGIVRRDEIERLRASIFGNRVIPRDDPTWAKRRKAYSVKRALVMRELALEYAA
jgi:DNA-directed RNA polymerase specialized sigma24 family protein